MEKTIVTIARQFGSGGREIGERLSQELGIPCYDKRLLDEASERMGIHLSVMESYDEKPVGRFAWATYAYGYSQGGFDAQVPFGVRVATAQFGAIESIAARGSCVMIGRCADYVLRDMPRVLRVFIYADKAKRIETVRARYSLSEENAVKVVKDVDKSRADYYTYFTGLKWGDFRNVHLAIDSGNLGVKGCVELIEKYLSLKGD